MEIKQYKHNGIEIIFVISNDMVRLAYCGIEKEIDVGSFNNYKWNKIVEVQLSGENQNDHHFSKFTGSSEGFSLKFVNIKEEYLQDSIKIIVMQKNEKIGIDTIFEIFSDSVIRSYSVVKNICDKNIVLEFVSSFACDNILNNNNEDWSKCLSVSIPHNYWQGECVWKDYSMQELGLYNVQNFSSKRINLTNNGGWSSGEHLPMGMLSNSITNEKALWQLEHNGAWHYELSTIDGRLYLMTFGPTYSENSWFKILCPNQDFISVKSAITFSKTKDGLFDNITSYRRKIRRRHIDNENLPVIFNDYMNCLFGNPTTQNEIPMIDKASEVGCEYYCIDCGWYDDGDWWDNVGEWKEAKTRFNGKLNDLTAYIRKKGMVAGLWLEIEVMGINCALAKTLSDDCFFMRNGQRIIDHSRYHLNFVNPKVIEFANGVVDRLISDYKIGYIKMDYNINCGLGNEYDSDSVGDGLLKHNRAYLAWIASLFDKYPDLVIENCASGGLRMDYATLAVHSIQSTSDQVDYKKYAAIAANYATAVTPEQGAIWSYPLSSGDEEETVFNMVNSMLGRIHQSGHLQNFSSERFELIKQGISCYKEIRKDLKTGLPRFLTNFNYYDAPYLAFGIACKNRLYVSVWNLDNTEPFNIDLKVQVKSGKIKYPQNLVTSFTLKNNVFTIAPSQKYQARFFEFEL